MVFGRTGGKKKFAKLVGLRLQKYFWKKWFPRQLQPTCAHLRLRQRKGRSSRQEQTSRTNSSKVCGGFGNPTDFPRPVFIPPEGITGARTNIARETLMSSRWRWAGTVPLPNQPPLLLAVVLAAARSLSRPTTGPLTQRVISGSPSPTTTAPVTPTSSTPQIFSVTIVRPRPQTRCTLDFASAPGVLRPGKNKPQKLQEILHVTPHQEWSMWSLPGEQYPRRTGHPFAKVEPKKITRIGIKQFSNAAAQRPPVVDAQGEIRVSPAFIGPARQTRTFT